MELFSDKFTQHFLEHYQIKFKMLWKLIVQSRSKICLVQQFCIIPISLRHDLTIDTKLSPHRITPGQVQLTVLYVLLRKVCHLYDQIPYCVSQIANLDLNNCMKYKRCIYRPHNLTLYRETRPTDSQSTGQAQPQFIYVHMCISVITRNWISFSNK